MSTKSSIAEAVRILNEKKGSNRLVRAVRELMTAYDNESFEFRGEKIVDILKQERFSSKEDPIEAWIGSLSSTMREELEQKIRSF